MRERRIDGSPQAAHLHRLDYGLAIATLRQSRNTRLCPRFARYSRPDLSEDHGASDVRVRSAVAIVADWRSTQTALQHDRHWRGHQSHLRRAAAARAGPLLLTVTGANAEREFWTERLPYAAALSSIFSTRARPRLAASSRCDGVRTSMFSAPGLKCFSAAAMAKDAHAVEDVRAALPEASPAKRVWRSIR